MNAEALHVEKKIFDVDGFITCQRLDEDAHESDETVLQVLIFGFFTGSQACRYVVMEKFSR